MVRDEAPDDRGVPHARSVGARQTTMIHGSQGTVRVAWLDGRRVTLVPLPTRCTVKLYQSGPELRLEVKAAATARTVTAAQLRLPSR